jgi:5-aminolevulinate synthase
MATMNYGKRFHKHIKLIKNEKRYRKFTPIQRAKNNFPKAYTNINGTLKEITVWSSNDSLCMGESEPVITTIQNILLKEGGGSSGSRNLSGTSYHHLELEQEVASLHNKEAGLIFTSGYVSNMATLSTIAKVIPEIIFFSDNKNHASIIEGIISSKAQKVIFNHNDLGDLEKKLQGISLEHPKIIIFESIYSMDGDVAPIEKICDLAEKYNAMTYVDEIHAVGMYGPRGAGMAASLGQSSRIDIIQAGFSKGYGLVGGYITGSNNIIDSIRSSASAFIFTTSLPSILVGGALASVRHLKESPTERKSLHHNVNYLKASLSDKGIPYLYNQTHIIPILVGNGELASAISQYLLQFHNIYLQAVNYPSVPKGTERFRVMVTARHTKVDIDNFIIALVDALQQFSPLILRNPMPKYSIASL